MYKKSHGAFCSSLRYVEHRGTHRPTTVQQFVSIIAHILDKCLEGLKKIKQNYDESSCQEKLAWHYRASVGDFESYL